jgi:molybdate transport system substrate-binding protein
MLIYCSAVAALQSDMPFLTSIKLPASLAVEPADGMIILDYKSVALRFVAFVMSEEGQATLCSYGFEPAASASPAHL